MNGTPDLLPDLFCCFFPLATRKRKRLDVKPIAVEIPTPKKSIKRRIELQCDRFELIKSLHSRPNYSAQKKTILDAISYDGSRTLLVWCPQHVVSNDYVITTLHQYGEVDHFIDNFSRMHHNSDRRIWYGTVVEYATVKGAIAAFRDMPLQCKHIKVLPLDIVLPILADCEILHDNCGEHSASTLAIHGRRPMRSNEKRLHLYMELTEYGKIASLLFDYRQVTVPSVICKVTYSCFTQAYLAMMMLHGQDYDQVPLSAKIEDEKEEIVEEAKKCLMMVIESQF